ncbi:MAG: isocitrate/isopropylmalate dehydrogenase family protein [Actinomycetia bacterium]|nr:isocitrate/isopropylmalate dehydrogenase family protein [Actinomycetes bacterium]MCP3911501.1 isocitrate/isopropylmalate dehydrogenase family protein [Actinomycetes bacterium]
MSSVCLIAGDDAAPEVVAPTVEVVDASGADIDWHPVDGAEPDAAQEMIDATETCLFGATNGTSGRALFHLRWGRQTYANIRPVRHIPGSVTPLARPDDLDFVIVRENLEDLYLGLEGDLSELEPLSLTGRRREPLGSLGQGSYAIKVITDEGSTRVARAAFGLAEQRKEAGRGPGRVTVAAKTNMLPVSDGRFHARCMDVAAEFPNIEVDSYIIDDFARRLVAIPHSLDVVVMPNLYGDILSDAAAGLSGGLGTAPSAAVGDEYAYFEPVHGSAPDIAGQGIINPTAQMLSAVMMLDHLGQPEAARRIESAVWAVYAQGNTLTRDQGGTATTRQFADAVLGELSAPEPSFLAPVAGSS